MDEEIPILINRTQVWKWINSKKFQMSGKLPKQLNSVVLEILEKALERAKQNKRKTLFGKDV